MGKPPVGWRQVAGLARVAFGRPGLDNGGMSTGRGHASMKEPGMWTCENCRETHRDNFTACWNCGKSRFDDEELSPPLDEADLTSAEPLQPKRRWCRFSLRTLLLVMLVFSVTVGWIGSRMKQAQENRDRVAAVEDAVAAIEKLGGRVTSEYKELRSQTWLEKQFDDPGDAGDLWKLPLCYSGSLASLMLIWST